jgi:hypothetical protein
MAKVTSSSNRSKRKTDKPVTKGQNPQRANRQAVSQAKVSTSGKGVTPGSAKVTTGAGSSSMKADAKSWQRMNQTASAKSAKAAEPRPRTPAPGTGNVERQAIQRGQAARAAKAAQGAKNAMGRMSGVLRTARTLRNIASAARLAGPVGAAAAVLAPRKLADGTLKGKPTGNPQGPAVPKRLTQGGLDKGSFDKAFKASRSAGKKTFTWRGKKYNTKLRGE